MGGFGSQAFLGCLHGSDGLIRPAVMVFLSDDIVDNPDVLKRVWQETELGTQIDHKNVIGVMGLAKLDEGYARVVDYADAESLRSVYRRATTLKTAVPPAIACAIVADACMGVHYAHDLGAMEAGEPMIHGGIRPETLQVSFAGMTKVTGYGATTIAEVMRKHRGTDAAKDAYTAPEQSYGGRNAATPQTDIYALGCVLYEALTNKAPFAADNELAEAMIKDELQKRQTSSNPDDSGNTHGITEAMAAIVLRATQKRSADRYATALEMRHALMETCEVADERAVRRFMDTLFPPDTVPRATRDQLLIAAREKPPAVTGTLLAEIPPELGRATRVLQRPLSDAEVEAAQGATLKRSTPPSSAAAAATLLPTPVPSAQIPNDARLSQPSRTQPPRDHQRAVVVPMASSSPDLLATGPGLSLAASAALDQAVAADDPVERARARRHRVHSPQAFQQTAAPVVYQTSPAVKIGLAMAAGIAVSALAIAALLALRPDAPVAVAPPVVVPVFEPAPVAPPVVAVTPVAPTTAPPPPTTPVVVAAEPKTAQPVPQPTGPGTLTISSSPALAITVNGKAVGTGSATFSGLAGRYDVVGKDTAQGITVKKTVKLKAGQTQSVALEAQHGRLSFDQLADGLEVIVDGKALGKTPLPTVEVWAGRHRVKVRKGGSEVPLDVNIPAGREAYITATFGG